MRFVYVMSEKDKDKMLEMGFFLIRQDSRNHIWVFKNKDVTSFSDVDEVSDAGINFVLSDTLMF